MGAAYNAALRGLQEIDQQSRAVKLVAAVALFDPDTANLLDSDQLIHSTHPDLTAAFLAHLFSKHTALPTKLEYTRMCVARIHIVCCVLQLQRGFGSD